MSDLDIIEYLARSAAMSYGEDPDNYPEGEGLGLFGPPYPWYSPDGRQRPWHRHVRAAYDFLAFYAAMQRLPLQTRD